MKKAFLLVFAAIILAPQVASAARHCTNIGFGSAPSFFCTDVPDPVPPPQCAAVYEHGSLGGAGWSVGKDNGSADISGAMIERRKWQGSLRGWKGSDRSWNDAISSVYVEPGCTLTTFNEANLGGSPYTYEGGSSGNTVHQVPNNDAISSFECHCGDGIGGGFYSTTLP